MTQAANDNPLLELDSIRIPFDRIRPEHVRPAVTTLLARARAAIREIGERTAPRTYATTLGALDDATEALSRAMGVVSHLESVATTPALREAYNDVKPEVSAFYTSIPLDPKLWEVLRAYAGTDDAKHLDAIRARHLAKTIDEFRRAGADLDEDGKKQLEAIDVELSTLTTKFSQNLLDATNAFELIVTDEKKLAGLPESAREAARASAQQKGVEGWRFTLQAPSVMAVLTYLDDAEIREKIWWAYNTRASSEQFDNRPHLLRILELRKAKAKLLGRHDFADLVLCDRMAKTGSDAAKFVAELEGKTRDAFEREKQDLEAFRKKAEGASARSMQPWDVGYWSEKQRKALYDFDEEALRPYFPAERALQGVFDIARRLYGIVVEPWENAPTWDPSVRTFLVRDPKRGEQIGAFYVDLYPRESKRGGAWMAGLITGGPIDGGGFSPHLGLFCANASPPVNGKPALLTHDEVETLFHEFGHLLHHLLSRVPVRSLAGTHVAWDFVELPSQIMENWTWEREALDLFARHVEKDSTIPGELFEKMQRARCYRAATAQMRQLGFATVDLMLHRVYDVKKDGDVVEYARRVMERFATTSLPGGYAMITGFSHLFAHPVGYAAGYYSYKWAEVLDADAFSRFQREGLFSEQVGAEFRDKLLSRGDADEPMKLFVDFMGREPDLNALLERNGLLPPTAPGEMPDAT
ncbi:M3 family metallopeptidase [Sandaracinus amylolyticus]|uniref:M3 family metallopeptidase n=1 Tax=Sandaracinus amylolyticus TaxID=927083 RepID=UPI001F3BD5A0|nr:M3 family metallopeptidase [Sandaracinus amylolyticus]UJR78485.1 Zn-dependent oligopeptidase [Sandaracinus amylolyticus]